MQRTFPSPGARGEEWWFTPPHGGGGVRTPADTAAGLFPDGPFDLEAYVAEQPDRTAEVANRMPLMVAICEQLNVELPDVPFMDHHLRERPKRSSGHTFG